MEGIPITCELGPLGPLLAQLHSFWETQRSTLPEGIHKKEINKLIDDLEKTGRQAMDLMEAVSPSFTARCWTRQVRELFFDIADYFDMLVPASAGENNGIRLTELKLQDSFKDTSKWRARLKDASKRYKMFKLDDDKPTVSLGPLPAQTRPAADYLIDGPMEKLSILLNEGNKVVPILGSAGVGKTTVARRLYHMFGCKFDCRAFVRASRNPDMIFLLTSMLSQIKGPQPQGFSHVHDLLDRINSHLRNKTYLIIVDDLWASPVWDIIRRAFPEGICRTSIITTTQVEDVALACCGYQPDKVFNMGPLNDGESRKLFFNRVCGSEENCPQQYRNVANEIISECGGLPLATVNIASLLATEPTFEMKKWEGIQHSLSSTLGTYPTSKWMKEVLSLVYNNLPPHLKTCLLYLDMYPEDCVIKKDDLVKQWLAEGFLNMVEGQDTKEVAGSYFDELVNRGLIQPVGTNYDDEVLSCTAHHIVQELISYKSKEENFNTSVDYFHPREIQDKVRRLSVKFRSAKGTKMLRSVRQMTQTRSLFFFGFFKCVPSIMEYKLLRVLILHIWNDQDEKSLDLAKIHELSLLKYLKIECNSTVNLPDNIQGLRYLATLDVDAREAAIPSDIVSLPGLLHLRLPSKIDLPSEIGYMTSLRSLGYINLSNNSCENVRSLARLTSLRDLHLTCTMLKPENLEERMEDVGSILPELSNLRSLSLLPDLSHETNPEAGGSSISLSCDGLSNVAFPPALLHRLELLPRAFTFSNLPKWIGQLRALRILKIGIEKLSRDDIDILKGMASVTVLSLYVRTAFEGRILVDKEVFPILKYFKFMCTALCLQFQEGAMLNVRRLKLGFSASTMEQYSLENAGFEHLIGVEVISVKIGDASRDESDTLAAKSALDTAIRKHPKFPILNLQLVNSIFGDDKGKGIAAHKEKCQTLRKRDQIMKEGSDERRGIQDMERGEDTTKQDHSRTQKLLLEQEKAMSTLIVDACAEISHPSHPEHKLKLEIDDAPFRPDGCMEPGAGARYSCSCQPNNFNLHKYCALAEQTLVHLLLPRSSFVLHHEAASAYRICDACGMKLLGFHYHCTKTDLDLHPCCA